MQIVCFRIGLVEKQIEDWKFEENNLEEQKERLAERVSHSPSHIIIYLFYLLHKINTCFPNLNKSKVLLKLSVFCKKSEVQLTHFFHFPDNF